MVIKMNRESALKSLKTVSALISKNTTIPITQEALFSYKDGVLKCSTTDLEVFTTVSVSCDMMDQGEIDFVGDVRMILNTISLLKSEFIDLIITPMKSIEIKIPSVRKKYIIPITYSAEDFPKMDYNQTETFSVNGSILYNMFKRASFATGSNDIRQWMQGVNMVGNGNVLNMQSSNGSVLCNSYYNSTEQFPIADFDNMIIPAKIFPLLVLFEESPTVRVFIGDAKRNVTFIDNSTKIDVRLLDDKYPNITPIMENAKDDKSKVVFDRVELLSAIKRLALYGNFQSKQIIFDFSNEDVVLRAENIDMSREASEIIDVSNRTIDNFVTSFNADYISTMANIFVSPFVQMTQKEPKYPAIFISDGDEGFTTEWLVAPIMLQN